VWPDYGTTRLLTKHEYADMARLVLRESNLIHKLKCRY
jgi:hypothetical protein